MLRSLKSARVLAVNNEMPRLIGPREDWIEVDWLEDSGFCSVVFCQNQIQNLLLACEGR
jgi:hypothetical protein